MIIYILRHGEAENKVSGDDVSRRLTLKGREQIKHVCEAAKLLGAKPESFISSPLSRARESGEIAKSILNPMAEVVADNCLEPESEPNEIYMALSKIKATESVLLISHMPLIGNLISEMLGTSRIQIKPGSLASIEVTPPPTRNKGTLNWLLPQFPS